MRILNPHGSKERLFEMMNKVNKLDESLVSNDKKRIQLLKKFVEYVSNEFGFKDSPKIVVSLDTNEAKANTSFGYYNPNDDNLRVVLANRNLADVCRTIGHELTHRKQKINGELRPDSGETGSDAENEANSKAGIFLREFGKLYPEIYE